MRSTLIFTGGHHTSALPVAQKLQKQGFDIIWFGHRHSQWGDTSDSAEYREVTSSGIEFYDLKAGKLYRTFHPLKLLRLPLGFLQAFYYLLRLRLKLKSGLLGIVSFGGYLAVPTVIAGRVLNLPSLTHEQTVITGWANKFISLLATKIALTWPDSRRHFPPLKTVVTGLPLRPEILSLTRRPRPRPRTGIKTLLVIGGKQGSHALNSAVFSALDQLTSRYRVVHQTGSSTLFNDHQTAQAFKNPRYRAYEYLSASQLSGLYSQSDVVLSRSGAHAVYEYALLGMPCVLVPIPWVSHDEQNFNAQILFANRQAILLPQSRLSPQTLLDSIRAALSLHPRPLDLPTDGLDRLCRLINETFTTPRVRK